MSPTLVNFISAGIGAAVTLLVAYLAALRNAFAVRAGAMQVVSKDLSFAADLITTYQEQGQLWGAQYHLAPVAWNTYRGDLGSHLGERSWVDLQGLATRLEVADRWAEELRKEGQEPDSEFDQNLCDLVTRIAASTKTLDLALQGSRAKLKLGRAIAFGASAAGLVALIVALVIPSSRPDPVLTRTSLAGALEERVPGTEMAICAESTELEGAYLCTLTSRACDGSLEASTDDGPSCSRTRRQTFGVTTSGRCFSANLNRVVTSGQPSPQPPGRIRSALIKFGCIKG